jgi:putative DNA primase/helicase
MDGFDAFTPLTDVERAQVQSIISGTPASADDTDTLELQPCPERHPDKQTFRHGTHGDPARVWFYRNPDGELVAVVARYLVTNTDGTPGKTFAPWIYGRRAWTNRHGIPQDRTGWHCKGLPLPRPLYRLDQLALQPDLPVLVCEGEKSTEAADALLDGFVCVASMNGSDAADKSDWSPMKGRHVTIWPDHDEPGAKYAASVAQLAKEAGAASVKIVEVPVDWPDGWDLADDTPEGVTFAMLQDMVEQAPTQEVQPEVSSTSEWPPPMPHIEVVAGELHNVASAAETAMIEAHVAVYQRGHSLVRPAVQTVPAAKGRQTVSAVLVEMNLSSTVDVFCQVAVWERFDARTNALVRTNPPRHVAEILLARAGHWRFPHIAGIVTSPTMRPDGSVLSETGYDASTRLYHARDSSLVLSSDVQFPTKEEAIKALQLLTELLAEFPFVDDTSKSVALSGLICPVVRGALNVVPLHAFRATTAGSGKSFLVDVASAIATGNICPVAAAGRDDAETEKRLAGMLLSGFPIASIDNVNGELGGDLLCQAIERPFVRLRRLGGSDITELENRVTLFATGNGLRVRGDMVRRTLVCDLDANMERPELREFQGNPVQTVLANRGAYVSACLIILRAYILAGQPKRLSPIASFEGWSDTVRSALVWLGCADPAVSMEVAREDDPELEAMRQMILGWREAFGTTAVTCRMIIDTAMMRDISGNEYGAAREGDFKFPTLRDALVSVADGARSGPDPIKLGSWLRGRQGRVVDGWRFLRVGITNGSARWKLAESNPTGKCKGTDA